MQKILFVLFTLALASCRTLGKHSEPVAPQPQLQPQAPLNPDFKADTPAPAPVPMEEPPPLAAPIPLPPVLMPDPEPAPASTPLAQPDPKFFHILPSATNTDELDYLIQYGACYSYTEASLNQLSQSRRALLKEGECPETLDVTAPVKGVFKRAGRCWLSQSAKLVGSLTLYNTTFTKGADGQYTGQSRGFPEVLMECAKVFGSFRGESDDLVIKDTVVGAGDTIAQPVMRMQVHYVFSVKGMTIREDSRTMGEPFAFALGAGQVIQGWDLGLRGMRKGGKRWLSIPPRLGYGERELYGVPANSTLEFEMELVDFFYEVRKSMILRNVTAPVKNGGSLQLSYEIVKNAPQLQTLPVSCIVSGSADFKNSNGATVVWRAFARSTLTIPAGQQSAQGAVQWTPDPSLPYEIVGVDASTLQVSLTSCEATVKI